MWRPVTRLPTACEYVQEQAELQAKQLTPELQHMDLAPPELPLQSGPHTDNIPSATVDLSHLLLS